MNYTQEHTSYSMLLTQVFGLLFHYPMLKILSLPSPLTVFTAPFMLFMHITYIGTLGQMYRRTKYGIPQACASQAEPDTGHIVINSGKPTQVNWLPWTSSSFLTFCHYICAQSYVHGWCKTTDPLLLHRYTRSSQSLDQTYTTASMPQHSWSIEALCDLARLVTFFSDLRPVKEMCEEKLGDQDGLHG